MATLAAAPAAHETRTSTLSLENVLYEKKGAVAFITLNRPQVLNALNAALLADLRAALEDARDDASIRGVILTGAGDKAFAAGADIAQLAKASAVEAERSSRSTQETLGLIENLGKPVVAAINGFALGGGLETAMACTIRIAVEHAHFGQPEVKLGVIPGGGGTQRLPRLVGKGRALQLMLTGGMIDSVEAYRIGLVNEIVAADGLIARAEAILQEIAANAPLAVRYAIQAVNSESESDGIVLEASYFGLLAGTEDKKEGTAAFIEKRPAHFIGR
jgi:enoyl-CoA hydratase